MEFYKTKLFGGEVNVLFTGPNYFFFHGFYGVICIAERVDEVELSNPSDEQVWKSKFILYSGHRDGKIEKESFALAKQIIEKYDQKYDGKPDGKQRTHSSVPSSPFFRNLMYMMMLSEI